MNGSVRLLIWMCWCAGRSFVWSGEIDFSRDIQPLFAENCLQCHGADKAEGGLRLDQKKHALAQLDSGAFAIRSGDLDNSELVKRISTSDPDLQMPPEGETLATSEIALIRKWIQQGADWSKHWAYRDLVYKPIPDLDDSIWTKSTMDVFVLDELAKKQSPPSDEAERYVLIRRLYADLIGLPPSIAELHEFLNDTRPDFYERRVDRLLASPHFGERWGRHWLDKARYADSDGYEKDKNRPNAWKYRDWVISAINADMPFDRFTDEQLAGDLLPNATESQFLATAFHRQTLTNTEGGTDQEQWRVAAVMDRTETLGAVWLGLTIGCARCHNHKYDQITQQEYYQLFAYFNNGDETNFNFPGNQRQIAEFNQRHTEFEQQLASLQQELETLKELAGETQADWEARLQSSDIKTHNIELKNLSAIAKKQRTEEQNKQLEYAYKQLLEHLKKLEASIGEQNKKAPKPPQMAVRIIRERNKDRRPTHVLRRGEFKQPLDQVTEGTPQVFESSSATDRSVQDRLQLSRWLTDGSNPLAARVAVNHIWQRLFGFGLVRTVNDFGVRGQSPTHPQLLDFLASEYVRSGWSKKRMIRQIVLSATYRQASHYRSEMKDIDPTNRLLYRQNRFRLEAEIIRDKSLAVSGLLTLQIGGRSVFPPMPPEVAAVSYANNFTWNTEKGANRFRRGMYTFFKRTAPHPTLMTLDCPDANVTNLERNRSNTPLGALVTLNNEVYVEAGIALAKTIVQKEMEADEAFHFLFANCLSRLPSTQEIQVLSNIWAKAMTQFEQNPDECEKLVGKIDKPLENAVWTVVARVVMNADEFVTRD